MASVVGQLLFHGHVREPHAPPLVSREAMTAEEIEMVAEHITEFSLAGIKRVRKAKEEGAFKEG